MPPNSTERLIAAMRGIVDVIFPPPWQAPLLVAVSGGADSMALLQLLDRVGCPLAVAHFDHQTRDGASTAEGDFVSEVGSSLGVPVHRGRGDIQALADDCSGSFEMVARKERYAFLAATAKSHGYGALATGHHGDDQAETVLMRLVRGCSPTGLAGIHPVTEMNGVNVIRPLLGFRRAELEAWLRTEEIPWREDISNQETDCVRNQIRHDLMPLLARDYNPRVVVALNRLAENQRRDDVLLQQLTAEALARCEDERGRLCREKFVVLEDALQYRVMNRVIFEAGGDGSFDIVGAAVALMKDGVAGKEVDLGNNVTLYCGPGHVVIAPRTIAATERIEETLVVPGEVSAAGCRIRSRKLARRPDGPLQAYCSPQRQLFDADVLGDRLTVRTRRPGDRFQPMGMNGTKKLKDYFNDLGLTRAERDQQLLLVRDDEIVWVLGQNISGAVAVTDTTTRWVEIEIDHRS